MLFIIIIVEPKPGYQVRLEDVVFIGVVVGCIFLYKFIKRTNALAVIPLVPLKYGTVWQRICGSVIDGLLFLPLLPLIGWLDYSSKTAALIDLVPLTFIGQVYYIYCIGRFGQTVGMWVMGIRVVKVDGSAAGWREAWLRCLVDILFLIPFIISFFIALLNTTDATYYGVGWMQQQSNLKAHFPQWYRLTRGADDIWFLIDILVIVVNRKRMALHDFIAGTVVIALPKKERAISATNISEMESGQSGPISN